MSTGRDAPSTLAPMWSRRAVGIMTVLLVAVGLVATWQTTTHARGAWWERQPRQAVEPDEHGVASAQGLHVAVDQVAVLESVPVWGEEVHPLAGHEFWHIGLHMDIADSEVSSCQVYVEDTQGRWYEVGEHAPSSVEGYSGYPTCHLDPDSNREVHQVQNFILVMPQDAQPRYIRVHSQFQLNPQYLELPAG